MSDTRTDGDYREIADLAKRLEDRVRTVFVGAPRPVRLSVLALLSGLHVLVEDIPGVGKTTLALSLARAAGLAFSRIQFTPDLLPGDVLGMNIWDSARREFLFKPGPIVANFVLADELNRASPRTQSAFLEAMQEGRVTVDGRTIVLPSPFFLFATQNPQSFVGTFPLPEAELDRFGFSFNLGYPSPSEEAEMLSRWTVAGSAESVESTATVEEIGKARASVDAVRVAPALREYLVAIVRATRTVPELRLGASPRAAAFLQQASRAAAAAEGRSFVIPEDVESMAVPVLAHRVILSSQARLSGSDPGKLIKTIVAAIPKPTGL